LTIATRQRIISWNEFPFFLELLLSVVSIAQGGLPIERRAAGIVGILLTALGAFGWLRSPVGGVGFYSGLIGTGLPLTAEFLSSVRPWPRRIVSLLFSTVVGALWGHWALGLQRRGFAEQMAICSDAFPLFLALALLLLCLPRMRLAAGLAFAGALGWLAGFLMVIAVGR
jgi:hypothetical protein